jgi:putative endonuclease
MCMIGNHVYSKGYRGFESLPLRHATLLDKLGATHGTANSKISAQQTIFIRPVEERAWRRALRSSQSVAGHFPCYPVCVYYVYLLQSKKDPAHKYIGFTEDLRTRIADHNEGKNPSTAPYRPWHLQTYLAFSSKKQALSFEKHIKSGSGHAFARRRFW